MEVIFSATMGDLASRSISFLVDRYLKKKAVPTEEERLCSLQRLILRVWVVVEEANGRLITNPAMLHQLSILQKEMYIGCYTLDVFRCRSHREDKRKEHQDYSYTPSEFNPAKRVRFCNGNNEGATQAELLEQVLRSVGDTIEDASEFVMFLCRCPRLYRQPFSMYLLLNKCMFGRQMEMEHIMNFLLQQEGPSGSSEGLAVLPIIGPGKVGKSTLIEHACDDERVRNHFSQILCFNDDDLTDVSLETIRDGRIKHQNHGIGGGRTLVIIELFLDIEDSVWKRLYSSMRSCILKGSKIIVASRFNKIASFGTTQPLRLQLFTREAYWYFFKVRTFGSTRSEDHPELTAIAMDIARSMNGCFRGATIFSGLLKANFNLRFWSMALATIRSIKQTNILVYGEKHCAGAWDIAGPVYLRRAKKTSSQCIVVFDDYHTCSAETEPGDLATMSVQDLYFGSVRPRGNFKVHAWTSHLPPHYKYMFRCGIQRPYRLLARKSIADLSQKRVTAD